MTKKREVARALGIDLRREGEALGNAGYALKAIGELIQEDLVRRSTQDQQPFLSENIMGGLATAIELIGDQLGDAEERFASAAGD